MGIAGHAFPSIFVGSARPSAASTRRDRAVGIEGHAFPPIPFGPISAAVLVLSGEAAMVFDPAPPGTRVIQPVRPTTSPVEDVLRRPRDATPCGPALCSARLRNHGRASRSLGVSFLAASLFPLLPHCSVDHAPQGLRATPPGDGPQVVFDLTRRPLPEIPQPNDVATFPDPTSRTGRRINVSMVAPTSMEVAAREGFANMEGWGTFAPITVAFSRGEGADPHAPAIDLDDVKARMTRDGHDFTNDPVYVVNLATGVPALLEMGDGDFAFVMRDQGAYWPNDPKANEDNLILESMEEGPGLSQSEYSPALDLDFDGVLDHPNTWGALPAGGIRGVDDLLTWYERESDTLILRPLVPLDEKTEYAVVLTDRLHAPDGRVARSPFPYVHHPEQAADVARLAAVLGDPGRANYYGDVAGTGLDHVAFAWTFTTQPTYEDLRLLRDGLYGRGPFARFADQFPAKATLYRAVGVSNDPSSEPDLTTHPECSAVLKSPYAVNVAASRDMWKQIIDVAMAKFFSLTPPQEEALLDSFEETIDHFVLGTFPSPYLIGPDPAHEQPDDRFDLDFKTGAGRVATDVVHFVIAVPKATATAHQPFAVSTWAHGTGLFDEQAIIRAPALARQGIATVAIDMPGHGLVLDPGLQTIAQAFLAGSCYGEWENGLVAGRAHDLDGDGTPDSGGLIWTSHLFHNRDNVRQAVLDEMNVVRILRTFDGTTTGDQDFNGDGKPDLAGDFDGDGTPDLGGPTVRYSTGGDSLGGIVAMIHGAVDPYVTSSTPISGGAGLTDVALHSSLTPTPVLEQALSPLVLAVPASSVSDTACAAGQTSLRFEVNDLFKSRELEIACLNPNELGPDMTAMVIDLRNKETRCGRSGSEGRLRIPVPADAGDKLQIQIFAMRDAVTSYGSCELAPGASSAPVRTVSTWEVAASQLTTPPSGATCGSDAGCQQYRDTFFEVGSPLVSPQDGLGYARQTPDFRRLFTLAQASTDPADPVNYARKYMMEPVPGLDGTPQPPRGIMVMVTVGDPLVPISTGISFARAAGAVPFLPPSAAQTMPEYARYAVPTAMAAAFGGKTPNDVLLDEHVIEGQSRLGRTSAGPACASNFSSTAPSGCGTAPDASFCGQTLFDADWLSEGRDRYDAPHPATPLRLARLATVVGTDSATVAQSWQPRIATLDPSAKDGQTWSGPVVALVNAYVNPLGQHVFSVADPCKAFDDVSYYTNLLSRFAGTDGNDVYPISHPRSHGCLADSSCVY
jgi:hypothetical protein